MGGNRRSPSSRTGSSRTGFRSPPEASPWRCTDSGTGTGLRWWREGPRRANAPNGARAPRTVSSCSGPLVLEQAVDDQVVESVRPASLAAEHTLACEPQPLRDRAASDVLNARVDRDPVQADHLEAVVDQRPAGTRDQSSTLELVADPVADIPDDAEGVPSQPGATREPPVDPDPASVQVLAREEMFQRFPLLLDRGRRRHPRQPRADPIALGLHQGPDLVEVVHPDAPQDRTVAEVGPERPQVHRLTLPARRPSRRSSPAPPR